MAQGPTLPNTTAYDPKLKTECSDYDPARARALLDLYGFVDKNGDGWRERPDGSPLVLRVSTQPQARDRKIAEVLDKNMTRARHPDRARDRAVAREPEGGARRQATRSGRWAARRRRPTARARFQRYDSRQIGGQNMARVRLPALDKLYDRLQTLPDGPERLAVFREAERIGLAYMPYKFVLNRRLARHDAAPRDRLSPAGVLAGLVAVRRHRRRRGRRREEAAA